MAMELKKNPILAINSGSSSYKCAIFNNNDTTPFWKAHLKWKKGFQNAELKVEPRHHAPSTRLLKITSRKEGLDSILSAAPSYEMKAVGHRIVHGGGQFHKTTLMTPETIEKLASLSELAPLHNPEGIEGILLAQTYFPSIPHFAVFDTTFHQTIPIYASTYPCPYQWTQWGIHRYGFHGINFQYCTKKTAEILNIPLSALKIVICHLGSGASLCAVKNGESLETTMGFTPLEGLMMSTRCGSIDPGILLYLLQERKLSLEQLIHTLNFESGLLGISGDSGDFKQVEQNASKGNERSQLALDMFLYRLNKAIGEMIAVLQGIDVIVFTGGIGEHSTQVRSSVCSHFKYLGMFIDEKKNNEEAIEAKDLSASSSSVRILAIPSQEEWEIAMNCWQELSQLSYRL